jgi:uncharacterized membrane protein
VATAERPSRPTPVKAAVGLLGAVLVSDITRTMLSGVGRSSPAWVVLAVVAIGTALLAGIALGRRLAFNLYVLLFACSLPQLVTSAMKLPGNVEDFVWNVVATFVGAIAITLLFSRPARRWFAALDD